MDEERRESIKESLTMIEDGLESLLELDDGVNDICEALEKGVVISTGEGMPTFIVKLVPNHARDILVV